MGTTKKRERKKMSRQIKTIHRLAGISLCSAVGLGAAGQHHVRHEADDFQFNAYQTANRYHYYHSFALFTAQYAAYPVLTASIFMLGMALFCTGGYCTGLGLLGEKDPKLVAMPIGGISFMIGWLTH